MARYDTIRLTSPDTGTVIDLPIVGLTQSSRYILKSVTGLGPPDIDAGVETSLDNAGIFLNARPQNREIVMLIRLNPNVAIGETVSDLRTALYSMISLTNDPTDIEIRYNNAAQLVTSGWVKKFEPSIFAPDAEVQITFACYQPYLVAPTYTNVAVGSLSKTTPTIVNPGNAPSGFFIQFTLTAAQSGGFTLTDDKGRILFINYPFLNGDILQIDTIAGARALTVIRGGVSTNLIQYLSADSEWLQLHAGSNVFTTSFSTFTWTTFLYYPYYWGI